MEPAVFVIAAIVFAIWIGGIVRLGVHRRFVLAALAVFFPFPGILIALYGLLAAPPQTTHLSPS